MFPAHIDYRKALQIILMLVVGCLFLMAMHVTAKAAQTQTFVVPMSDGYGTDECLKPGSSCGQIVADAWCEAHGLDKSLGFGPADDITASTGAADTPHAQPGSVIISCQE
jgi:hypothetical protein